MNVFALILYLGFAFHDSAAGCSNGFYGPDCTLQCGNCLYVWENVAKYLKEGSNCYASSNKGWAYVCYNAVDGKTDPDGWIMDPLDDPTRAFLRINFQSTTLKYGRVMQAFSDGQTKQLELNFGSGRKQVIDLTRRPGGDHFNYESQWWDEFDIADINTGVLALQILELYHFDENGIIEVELYSKQNPCPGNFSYISNRCYHFNPRMLVNWNDANTFCTSQGATLIAFETRKEFVEVYVWITNNYGHPSATNKLWTSGVLSVPILSPGDDVTSGSVQWQLDNGTERAWIVPPYADAVNGFHLVNANMSSTAMPFCEVLGCAWLGEEGCDGQLCDSTDGQCEGGCVTGWTGSNCQQACSAGTYGVGCTSICAHCGAGDACDPVDGVCPGPCESGWRGTMCDLLCIPGSFGADCTTLCGHCSGGEMCNRVDGTCSSGCKDGWLGTFCDTACASGSWGAGCSSPCGHCSVGDTCNNEDGACPGGCQEGWQGTLCDTACAGGSWGAGCSSSCGHCSGGDACDDVDGTCPGGCQGGWQGSLCTTECPSNTYGVGCSKQCHCQNDTQCDFISGNCANGCETGWMGDDCQSVCHCGVQELCYTNLTTCGSFSVCESGYMGADCQTPCTAGYFGYSCLVRCQCHNDVPCDRVTGICPGGCQPGYQDIYCQDECSQGSYGADCSQTCHCSDPEQCDAKTGVCHDGVCSPGWVGATCQYECEDGTYGSNCHGVCHCADGKPCDKQTGQCPGSCAPGWIGDQCSVTDCPEGFFGDSCLYQCHCLDRRPCDKQTGHCPFACTTGWTGRSCDQECAPTMSISKEVQFSLLGGGSVLGFIFITGCFVHMLRKGKGKATSGQSGGDHKEYRRNIEEELKRISIQGVKIQKREKRAH